MPLKIRCPHCQAVAVVPDAAAGEQRPCDSCHVNYTVPLPSRAVSAAASVLDVSGKCPRCGAAVAPGTVNCPKCQTDLATGVRPPLGRRLTVLGVRAWVLLGLGAITGAAVAWLAVGSLIERLQQADPLPPPVATLPPPVEVPPEPAVSRLFSARDEAARAAAAAELGPQLPGAAPELAKALERSLIALPRAGLRDAQLLAIELLSRAAPADALPVLQLAGQHAALRGAALHSRALLGDLGVLAELATGWQAHLRRELFHARCVELSGRRGQPAAQAVLRENELRTRRAAAALRSLGQPALQRLVVDWWRSWAWLGQRRDEGYAYAVFAIAMPARNTDLDAQKEVVENVRAARDALSAIGDAGPAAARAAAAVILKQCAPQYASARERIVAALAGMLAASAPADQQLIVWTLSELTGRPFDGVSAHSHPADVSRPAVAAALEWIRAARLATVAPAPTADAGYPRRPRLVRRIYTARRQYEASLVGQLQRDTQAANAAAAEWLRSDLPFTPRLAALLNPAQRRPHGPALAATMAIAAARHAAGTEQALRIWCDAADQPAWVRNLARTALAAIKMRRGAPIGPWPANLDAAALAALDETDPGWAPFGQAVAGGGGPLLRALRDAPPDALPGPLRDKLLRAAEQAVRTRGDAPRR